MPRSYYNSLETGKSLDLLRRIANEVDFVLIGGWAVNFYTGKQGSTDIDVAVGPERLEYFRKYGIQDYGIDVKYSIIDGVNVDLFINGISDKELTIPIGEILRRNRKINGMKVVDNSILLLLKLCGYFREDPIKLNKDIIDTVSLLFYTDIDMDTVKGYVKKYGIDERKGPSGMLEYLDKGDHLWEYITDSQEEYKKLKVEAKKKINNAFYR